MGTLCYKLRTPGGPFAWVLFSTAAVFFALGMLRGSYNRSSQQIAAKGDPEWLPLPFYLNDSISAIASELRPEAAVQLKKDRPALNVFVGILTTPSDSSHKYAQRRKAIRDTFLPHLYKLSSTKTQFVVGRSQDPAIRRAFAKEVAEDPDSFLHLDMDECYRCLPVKTTTFVVAVHRQFDAKWIIKVDDDVYLSPARLLLALEQYEYMGVEYIGCMKHGDVHMDPEDKWYEPAWRIVGFRNHLHAYGSIYVLSGRVVSQVLAPNGKFLRPIANEDTTMGLWMLAFNVTFFEDMRLCSPRCHPHGVGFLDNACSGLCNPVPDMYALNKLYYCKRPITPGSRLSFMPSWPGHQRFDVLKEYKE